MEQTKRIPENLKKQAFPGEPTTLWQERIFGYSAGHAAVQAQFWGVPLLVSCELDVVVVFLRQFLLL
jgi:hypothetical protein